MCHQKLNGGLGLKDTELENATVGGKTWQRWLQTLNFLWTQISKKKYSMEVENELIRLEGNIPSSLILNIAM